MKCKRDTSRYSKYSRYICRGNYLPSDTLRGNSILPHIASCKLRKGFSKNTSIYNKIPKDHISNSGPRYL